MSTLKSPKITVLGVAAGKNTAKYFFLIAAKKLGLKVREFEKIPNMQDGVMKERTVLCITDGKKNLLTLGATTSQTSYLGMKIAVNKTATNTLLRKSGVPTTEQIVIRSEKSLSEALSRFGKFIMKPSNSRAGKGVFSNIQSFQEAKSIYTILKRKYDDIVAERIIGGKEYRVLVVNGSVFAVAEYVPPSVTGNGASTIAALIRSENAKRLTIGDDHLIKVNSALRLNLKDAKLSMRSVLPDGESVVLHKAAPISNGGYAIDATDKIHPTNRRFAEQVATLVNIDIAGIDIITENIDQPLDETGGAVIEINGGPDLDVHFSVHKGKSRNGTEAVLKNYFGL
jgi:cyanophycin synthetase